MLEGLVSALVETVRERQELAIFVVLGLGFAESIPFLSLAFPSTVLFLIIGALYAEAGGIYWHLVAAGAIGAFLGDLLTYAAGRIYRERLSSVWPFTREPGLLPKCRAFFERYGALGVFGSKFLGAIRAFIPLTAGILDMPWGTFILASATSSIMWAAVFLAPGFGLWLLWH